MPSIRHEGEKKEVVWSWEGHVDKMIREAQARGDFDNLPGAGKPLNLEENVFAGDMDSAFRVARNANAAPLWVQLDGEIGDDTAALRDLLERTARYLQEQASLGGSSLRPGHPRSMAGLEAERQRARALYLRRAAELDKKIDEYNANRPRTLSWLEKMRLLPAVAARQFDQRIPPYTATP
jgi:DnaJ homolog subfamily C member 28